MSFMQQLKNEMNVSMTENGALGHKTTFNPLLDFDFKSPSYRNDLGVEYIISDLIAATKDFDTLFRYVFFLRDVRGGKGERYLFRVFLKQLAFTYPDKVRKIIPLVSEYGRWDDLLILLNTSLKQEVTDFIKKQLFQDMENALNNKPISLLAKWLPSENASNVETKRLAKYFANSFYLTPKMYRQLLSGLRGHLKVVETFISKGEYDKIDYAAVPSKANLRYARLFLLKDKKRRQEYLESLKKGEVKINAGNLYPHEIISRLYDQYEEDTVTEGLWRNLRDFGKVSNVLPVVDVSGSMLIDLDLQTQAIDVSVGLGLYFAERNTGEFKNKIVTFSDTPELVDISNYNSIYAKYSKVCRIPWGFTTNIEAVMDLVLQTAVKAECAQEEIPTVLIISDMEFNAATSSNPKAKNFFESISKKFEEKGYKMPRVVFWNVASRTNTIPIIENENGLALVSGYSPVMVKTLMTMELDPYKALLECINVPRYDAVVEALHS